MELMSSVKTDVHRLCPLQSQDGRSVSHFQLCGEHLYWEAVGEGWGHRRGNPIPSTSFSSCVNN